MSQWAILEFLCDDCGRFESLEPRATAPDALSCPDCGSLSQWVVSAPQPKVLSVPCTATVRGGDMKDRPRGMLDTRALADGMPLKEWKAKERKVTQERRHQQMLKGGLKSKRIQVG